MSLVGTRPPTVDEWKQYEPYHRGRLAVKPGLTGMWQVSGRSDITDFEEVVKLDIGNVLTYSLYGVLHDNDHEKLKQLISYYRKLYRYIAAAVTVVGLAIVPFLGQLVKSTLPHNEVVLYYLLFLCNSVVSYFVMFKVTLLRADQKEYIRNIVATICLLLQYVLQIAFLYVNNNYTTYLIIQIFFTVMQNVVCNVIANKYYGNVLISLVTAFIGYYVLSDMAKLMHENAFLQWCGKNSIIVYVVHFSIVQGTRGILVRLLPLPMEILGWIVFVVAVLIVLAVGKICERHFMFAFGK